MGKILGRYILREVATVSLLVTGGLLVILLADQLAAVLQRAAANQFPQGVVLQLILLGTVQTLWVVLPFGLLAGVVLAFGRLYHDSEMAAALACGASPRTLYTPVAVLAVAVAAIVGLLTLKLAPDATIRTLNLRTQALQAGQFAPIAPGKFRLFGGGNAVVYAEGATPDGTLTKVFIERNVGAEVEVAVAETARHKASKDGMTHEFTLHDGQRYEGVPGSAEWRLIPFEELVVPMQVPPLPDVVRNLDAQPSWALLGSTDRVLRAELQWRIALPVLCIVLALLAIPLSRLRPRQGRYDRAWVALLVYFLYIQLLTTGKSLLGRGTVPAVLGLWWVHILVALLAFAIVAGPGFFGRLRYRGGPSGPSAAAA